ncbi:SDR family NAD(P)-dependent oxidoreductase [Auritidibacter ignavus]|uniref:SDR family NAD(P)-dependent oxidoreductase n=1 Tax=Auritidibacter ignavus TaxID=678932 RepID=UPI00109C3B21|nr:SDR family NAD(P)-dependent oxidoreductase [Auritidibacter ignavus]
MVNDPQTIVITGASDGIGAEAARQLSETGHRLVLIGRSPSKTRAIAEIVGTSDFHVADFADLHDVKRLADELRGRYDRIDVLANNAGGLFSGPTITGDGFEKTFQVNHLSPFLLTHLLIDRLLETRALVVNTSSIGARIFGRLDLSDMNSLNDFKPNRAYGNAKLANILFARGLTDRFRTEGLSAIAFHPGIVATSFASDTDSYFRWVYHTVLKVFLISPAGGGANLRLFIDPRNRERWESGTYYNEKGKPSRTNQAADDDAIVEAHWRNSCELLGISW